ncbi:hypothetical protein D3C75_1092450 [compost metagenome]
MDPPEAGRLGQQADYQHDWRINQLHRHHHVLPDQIPAGVAGAGFPAADYPALLPDPQALRGGG